jgi:putative transposase
VKQVVDWPYSSFHRCVRRGHYPTDWGDSEPDYPQDCVFGE